jgi:hypothetical protein
LSYKYRVSVNRSLVYCTRKRQIFTILKWLQSAFPDSLLESAFPREEDVERVAVSCSCSSSLRLRIAESISVFSDSAGYEVRISFRLTYSSGVPEATALLMIYKEKELLYAKKGTHEDHEDLSFMLQFLTLFSIMWWYEEHYFKECCILKERAEAVEKFYANRK